MQKQKVTKEMCQEFNKMYEEGSKMSYIAYKYGIGASTVSRYIWKPRQTGREYVITKEIGQSISLLKAEGHKVKDIKKLLSLSETSIYNYLRRTNYV